MAGPPPPPTASSYPGYTTQTITELAGFWRRLGAYVIDAVILGVAGAVVQAIIGAVVRGSGSDTTGLTVRSGLIGFILELAYFGYLWSRYGQSVGYMALGIRLVRGDGGPISGGLAVLRAVLVYLSFALCLVPAIVSAFTIGLGRQKQAIHDMMLNTFVVRT